VRLAASPGVLGSQTVYFAAYWITLCLSVPPIVMAVRESFLHVLRPVTRLSWFRVLFWVCLLLAAGYSIVWAILHPAQATELPWTILLGEQTLEYTVIVSALLYFALVRILSIHNHRYESGIMLG